MILYTTATNFLASLIKGLPGKLTIKRFCDGEVYIRIDESVREKKVWVISSTIPPAEHMLELFFLFDALQREKIQINLILTYYAYARQDKIKAGESLSAEVIAHFFNTFQIQKFFIVHVHSSELKKFLSFENVIPYEFFYSLTKEVDAIVAPDKGAIELAQHIADHTNKELVVLEKVRPEQEKVKIITINGLVQNKRVLIVDDMITTGNTVIQSSNKLLQEGAQEITVAATHGVFCGDAVERLAHSSIKKTYITNSIEQTKTSDAIEVVSIAPLLESLILPT